MELDWSEQSAHIRTLYHPWQSGDGFEEQIIAATERQFGIRFPTPLRTFYQAWGRRKDLTQTDQFLLGLDQLVMRPDALIFCVDSQSVHYWAILCEDLEKDDPPVVMAYALPDWEVSEISSPLIWMLSYEHVSIFIDTIAYHHAFCGGAIHGGWTDFFRHQDFQNTWLEQHWERTTVGPMVYGLVSENYCDFPLYVLEGQALAWGAACSIATRSAKDIDQVSQVLGVTWKHRW